MVDRVIGAIWRHPLFLFSVAALVWWGYSQQPGWQRWLDFAMSIACSIGAGIRAEERWGRRSAPAESPDLDEMDEWS